MGHHRRHDHGRQIVVGPGVRFRRAQPPGVSRITAPAHLVGPRDPPAADSNVVQVLGGDVSAASGDGHLLLSGLHVTRMTWKGQMIWLVVSISFE